MKCPFCGEKMKQGKVCSNDALWWRQEGMNGYRLNDEGRILGRINGDRISAFRCRKCKKIIIDEI